MLPSPVFPVTVELTDDIRPLAQDLLQKRVDGQLELSIENVLAVVYNHQSDSGFTPDAVGRILTFCQQLPMCEFIPYAEALAATYGLSITL